MKGLFVLLIKTVCFASLAPSESNFQVHEPTSPETLYCAALPGALHKDCFAPQPACFETVASLETLPNPASIPWEG